MNTAVIINLDYETQPIVKCRQLWKMIELRMGAAGFSRNSRRFVTSVDIETACKQAQGVMESIEADYKARGLDATSYIRDFYAVPCNQMINLAVPADQAIEVDLMASGAFQKFFS
jgi:hypothetical protein